MGGGNRNREGKGIYCPFAGKVVWLQQQQTNQPTNSTEPFVFGDREGAYNKLFLVDVKLFGANNVKSLAIILMNTPISGFKKKGFSA